MSPLRSSWCWRPIHVHGNALDTHRGAVCRCTPTQRRRYLSRLSGPLLDRVDVRVVLTRPSLASLAADADDDSSELIAARVREARAFAAAFGRHTVVVDGRCPSGATRLAMASSPSARQKLDSASRKDSMRGRDRVIRVAWSIAALAGRDEPSAADIDDAISLRASEQQWAA